MSQTITIHCLSEAISPITHMARTEGNEALVAREPVATALGVRWIPCLSGNAVRHRCVREPGARWLVDRLGLAGRLSIPQLNFLFHGGNLTEGGGREDTHRIANMQRLFPLLRLLGGSLPDQILAGSLHVWRGLLACEENQGRMAHHLPAAFAVEGTLRPAEHFVSGYQYTRGDSATGQRDLLPPAADVADASNLMIMAGQCVMPGALFVHGFVLCNVAEVELGALLLSLSLWGQAGGTVGGQAAKGHGRLKTWLLGDVDQQAAIDAYTAHVEANADECLAWLQSAFKLDAASQEKKAKANGKKGKAKAGAASE